MRTQATSHLLCRAALGTPSTTVDVLTGEELEEDNGEYVLQLCANPDGKRVAAIVSDFSIDVRRARRKAETTLPPVARFSGAHRARITGAAWLDATSLISCDEAGAVYRWSLASPSAAVAVVDAGCALWSLAVGCGGTLLALGTESTIIFVNLATGRRLGEFMESHTERVVQLLFHPATPTLLFSCSEDGLVCLFDVSQSGEENALLTVANIECAVERIGVFGAKLDHIWVITGMETLNVWRMNADDCEIVAAHPAMRDELRAAGVASAYLLGAVVEPSSQELRVMSGDRDGRISLTAVVPGGALTPIATLAGGHNATVRCFASVRAGSGAAAADVLLTGGEDAQLCAWGARAPTPCRALDAAAAGGASGGGAARSAAGAARASPF